MGSDNMGPGDMDPGDMGSGDMGPDDIGDTSDTADTAESISIKARTTAVKNLDWVEEEKIMVDWNIILRVGTWNVRSLSDSDRSAGGVQAQRNVISDVGAEQLALVAVQECRWQGVELARPMGPYMWYGGGAWKNTHGQPNGGVIVGVHKRWNRAVIAHAHRGGRVQFVVLRGQLNRRIIFGSVYAPTENAPDAEKDAFWRDVTEALEELKPNGRDLLLIAGDYNGETGRTVFDSTDRSAVSAEMLVRSPTGMWGCGTSNANGQRLLEECNMRRWCLAETHIARPPRQKWSFRGTFDVGEGVRRHREYDHFAISLNLKGTIQDVRNVWKTRHDSDHCLRVMELRLGGKEFTPSKPIESVGNALRREDVGEAVDAALRKAMPGVGETINPDLCDDLQYKGVIIAAEDLDLQETWDTFKRVAHEVASGLKKPSHIHYQGMTETTLALIHKRTALRITVGARSKKPTIQQQNEIKTLSRNIYRQVRLDKAAHLELLASQVQTAVDAGNMRVAYKALKSVTGKGQGGAANLQTMDMDKFTAFYKDLLGKPSQDVPQSVTEQRTWARAEEMLADKTKHAKPWDIDCSAPSLKEFEAMVMKSPNEKGLSDDQICVELMKHSPAALVMVHKMVVIVWGKMMKSSPGEKLDIPADFVRATLVCLYKGKGSKDDPAKYRGISLIPVVERFISSLLLGRIGKDADKRMKQGQAGFRPLKSCRDAVFRLWRDLEKTKTEKMPSIYTFVDYSKAFDSLVWARMWDILEFQGCPAPLIAVIRALHEAATIALRINSEGDIAPEFEQKKGIRQGSGLSPCLFVLVLDFVMRAFEEASAEQGTDRTKSWNAYADDVVDKTVMAPGETLGQLEQNASSAMQLLEGAAGFTGLLVNVPKTEAMGCWTHRPGANRSETWRERAKVTFPGRGRPGHRSLDSYHGWIADAKWGDAMGVEGSIHAEIEKLEKAFPNTAIRVVVLDWREGVTGEQLMTANVKEDFIDRSATTLSADMIKRRDEWMAELGKFDRDRVALRMTNAATPGAAWQHVIASLVADKPLKRAPMRKSFLDAIEAEKLVAKSTSSSSIHNPAPERVTISKGKRFLEENARFTAVEQLHKEVHEGNRRVLVLAELGAGSTKHIGGATLPVLRLGFSQCLNGEKFGFVDCPRCKVTMMHAKSLTNHQASKGDRATCCLSYQEAAAAVEAGDMTERQVAMRRHQRMAGFKRSGKLEADGAEPVKVMTCSGVEAATCKRFVYLGSMISPDSTAQPEIRRRAMNAMSIFGDLDRVWKSRCISWKLKGQLFSSLVLSVMLYNAEVWPLTKDDTALLEGIYGRMTRSLCRRATRKQSELQQKKITRIKNKDVLKLLGLPTMTALLRQKRLRWVGHALRRTGDDLSKMEVKKELALSSSTWTKCVLSDMKELKIKSVK
jgi:hypothetical protein